MPQSPTSTISPSSSAQRSTGEIRISTLVIILLIVLNLVIWTNRLMESRSSHSGHHVYVHPTHIESVDAAINGFEERYEETIERATKVLNEGKYLRNGWEDKSHMTLGHAETAKEYEKKAEQILQSRNKKLSTPPPHRSRPESSSTESSSLSSWFHLDTPTSMSISSTGQKKNLAIGMAQGINDAQLCVFVASLRKYSPPIGSDIVLFMDKVSAKAREILDQHKVTAIEFSKDTDPDIMAMRDFHPSTYRWPMIHRYISSHSSEINKVLLADVRDMAFQADPFTIVKEEGLYVFNGVESMTIGKDGWNGGWVKDCFGEEVRGRINEVLIYISNPKSLASR